MDVDELIDRLDEEGRVLAERAGAATLDDAVPTCPDWKVRDLLHHVGHVHRWAAGYVTGARTEMLTDEEEKVLLPSPPPDGGLVDWFADGHRALVAALRAAPADLECWTFMAAPSPLSFWARRQAHETAIHRADVDAVVGERSSYPPEFAVDGLDELLSLFLPRSRRLHTETPRTVMVKAVVAGPSAASGRTERWLLRTGPEAPVTTRLSGATMGSHLPVGATVEGAASDLYLRLWNRLPAGAVIVSGDAALLKLFADKVTIRWH